VDLLPSFAVSRDVRDLRILENTDIELRRFFRLIVEPQTRGDALDVRHTGLLSGKK
jgi:hypothetical protein